MREQRKKEMDEQIKKLKEERRKKEAKGNNMLHKLSSELGSHNCNKRHCKRRDSWSNSGLFLGSFGHRFGNLYM